MNLDNELDTTLLKLRATFLQRRIALMGRHLSIEEAFTLITQNNDIDAYNKARLMMSHQPASTFTSFWWRLIGR